MWFALMTPFLPTIVRLIGDYLDRKAASAQEKAAFRDFVRVLQGRGLLPSDMKSGYDQQGPDQSSKTS